MEETTPAPCVCERGKSGLIRSHSLLAPGRRKRLVVMGTAGTPWFSSRDDKKQRDGWRISTSD